ncbi:hypothetical protein B0H13DRAFT_2550167 [Mycena leptocephala]|nr:hypothetical protein B0H13DRAFT_2550167 [Mycena leptocephala]
MCAEFRAAVLELCADVRAQIASLIENASASTLELEVINATTKLCDILCNFEPDPQLIKANPGLRELPPDSDPATRLGEPELRDPARSESNMDIGESDGEGNELEATEALIRVSGVVDCYANPAIDPAVLSKDDSDIAMTEEANFPSMPELGGEDRRHWFRRIAIYLPNKVTVALLVVYRRGIVLPRYSDTCGN